MTVYILLIFIIIIIAIADKYTHTYGVEYIGILLISLATLRALSVGSDTISYYDAFVQLPSSPSKDRHYVGLQIVWYYLNYIFKELLNFRWFLFFCSGMFVIPSLWIFKRLSPYPILSCFILLTGLFYISSLNVMRQFTAIGIVIISYYYFYKQKYLSSLVLIIISACFHSSSLVVLSIFIIKFLKIDKNWIIIASLVLTFIVGFFYVDILTDNIVKWTLGDEDTFGYNQYFLYFGFERNIFGNLVKNLIFLITYHAASDKNNFFLRLYFISIILNNLFGAAGHATRIFLYFSIAMCIAIPISLHDIRNIKHRRWYTIIIIFCLTTTYCLKLYTNNSQVCPYLIDFN